MGNKLMKHVDSGPGGMVLFYCLKIYEPAERIKKREMKSMYQFFMQNTAKMY